MKLQAWRLPWILNNYSRKQFFKETGEQYWPREIWIWFSSGYKAPMVQYSEIASWKCSVNKVFFKKSQNSQESTNAEVSF